MRSIHTAAALALSAVMIFGLTTPALAQGNGAPEPAPVEISNGLLDRLVVVYPVVSAIAQDAEARIAEAETEPVARAIQDLAEETIILVLEEVELTAAAYVAAIRSLNDDHALRARFRRMLDAAQASRTD